MTDIEHYCEQFNKAIEWGFIKTDRLGRWVTPYIFQREDDTGSKGMTLKYCPFCGIRIKDEILITP
jgi:hypothetical protein